MPRRGSKPTRSRSWKPSVVPCRVWLSSWAELSCLPWQNSKPRKPDPLLPIVITMNSPPPDLSSWKARASQPWAERHYPVGVNPMPATTPEKQKAVERLVDHILAAKQRDALADVSALEREIDELVYALYGL